MGLPQRDNLSAKEVVARWGVLTTGTLANWRVKKEGPPFVKFGTRVMYPVADLIKWEAANTHLVPANDNEKPE